MTITPAAVITTQDSFIASSRQFASTTLDSTPGWDRLPTQAGFLRSLRFGVAPLSRELPGAAWEQKADTRSHSVATEKRGNMIANWREAASMKPTTNPSNP